MSELRFDQQVALVTGVSTFGLGLTYATMLAERGCAVAVNDLGRDWAGQANEPGVANAVRRISDAGGRGVGVEGDVVHDAERIVAETVEAFGRLDIVINNAGAGGAFDTLVDVHLRGAQRVSEAAWSHLQQGGQGRILNIASGATFGSPAMPGYAAAKGGVLALTRTQAIVGAPVGIRANAVLPSAWTRSTAGIEVDGFGEFMRRRFPPEAVGAFAVYLVHDRTTVSGEAFSVGGGLVSRVVQAETHGAVADQHTPESWGPLIDEVMESDYVRISASMWAQLDSFVERLGPAAHAEWRKLGIRPDSTGKARS